MEFGKLSDISQVDFSLPPEPESNRQVLSGMPDSSRQVLYIGCTGWSMKAWVGWLYPPKTPAGEYLRHYGRQFNTIELNATHYTIPRESTIRQWYSQTPDDFRFCPKVWQTVSHSRDLGAGNRQFQDWSDAIRGFSDKLGACFMQLPPHVGAGSMEILGRWLESLPNDIPMAIEMRNADFFAEAGLVDEWIGLLRNAGAYAVITDVAGRRDVSHMRLSGRRTVIRFVGNGLHPTDYQRIDDWVGRLKSWFDAGLEEAFFFTHEPDNLLAPELADYLARSFKTAVPQVQTRGPDLRSFEQQLSLF